MSFTPKIFISHSLHKSGQTDYLDTVKNALEENGFDYFFDKDGIRREDVYHCQIYREIGFCHGAIILINKHAMASDWVAGEAFSFRVKMAREDNDFFILPITVEDIDVSDLLKEKIRAACLTDFLLEKAPCGEELAQAIKDHFGFLNGNPEKRLEYMVAERLPNISAPHLQAIKEAFMQREPLATGQDHPRTFIARRIADYRGLEFFQLLLERLVQLMDEDKIDHGNLKALLRIIFPRWVSLRAAAPLHAWIKSSEEEPERIFTVEVTCPEMTIPCYLIRGTGDRSVISSKLISLRHPIKSKHFRCMFVDLSDYGDMECNDWDEEDPFVRRVRNLLLKEPNFEDIPDPDIATINERLNESLPIVAVLKSASVQNIKSVNMRFPSLFIIAPMARDEADGIPFKHLTPNIPQGEEAKHLRELRQIRDLFDHHFES